MLHSREAPTYDCNTEQRREALIEQLRHARGSKLVAPLLAHAHSLARFGYAEQNRVPRRNIVPNHIESFDLTLLYRQPAVLPPEGLGEDPTIEAPLSAHDRSLIGPNSAPQHPGLRCERTDSKSSGRSGSAAIELKLAKSVAERKTSFPWTPNPSVKSEPQDANEDLIHEQATKSPVKYVKKNTTPVISSKVNKRRVPANISSLVAAVKQTKRNAQGLLIRAPLRVEDGFREHFDRNTGRLRPDSPLMHWYGDERLFTYREWKYLVAEATEKKTARKMRLGTPVVDCTGG
ncbi:hypothetical protein LTR62_002598 [Meristemomyces frigidus]|uniref:Uncharacterized protein n=1 Tax=Meristemomyces frigidus TaxID=1508187 RepID=A0AAN7TFM1_9PEZI|nr:hypothetical protein LTR62_002598 [Meristemomyces frigidus]